MRSFAARFGDHVLARVGGAHHQRHAAVERPYDRVAGEHDLGARAREAREDQPRRQRDAGHADKDFQRRDPVRVDGLRVHVAIADRRERFDAEEKRAAESRWKLIGDRRLAEHVERGKHGVEQQEQNPERDKKHRPADHERTVIEILPERRRHAVRDDHAIVQAQFPAAARATFLRTRLRRRCWKAVCGSVPSRARGEENAQSVARRLARGRGFSAAQAWCVRVYGVLHGVGRVLRRAYVLG